jgi:hypothetical protein
MKRQRNYLQSLLAGESRAYGFTIAFWGSGAMLIKSNGLPGIQLALLYGLGAVTGFGIMAIAAFGKTSNKVSYEEPEYLVLGTMHYLASLVPIIIAYCFTQAGLPSSADFFLSGLGVSMMYNLFAVLEEDIVEKISSFIPV